MTAPPSEPASMDNISTWDGTKSKFERLPFAHWRDSSSKFGGRVTIGSERLYSQLTFNV
jgi:hypothetical protein